MLLATNVNLTIIYSIFCLYPCDLISLWLLKSWVFFPDINNFIFQLSLLLARYFFSNTFPIFLFFLNNSFYRGSQNGRPMQTRDSTLISYRPTIFSVLYAGNSCLRLNLVNVMGGAAFNSLIKEFLLRFMCAALHW